MRELPGRFYCYRSIGRRKHLYRLPSLHAPQLFLVVRCARTIKSKYTNSVFVHFASMIDLKFNTEKKNHILFEVRLYFNTGTYTTRYQPARRNSGNCKSKKLKKVQIVIRFLAMQLSSSLSLSLIVILNFR